jgi:SNF family Na+-dependent transporter
MDPRPVPQPDNKMQWGTRLGIILAVAGSAVGLGNFLRFPGNAAANGGGAFMIPYFISFLLLGIPIGWAEWAMGRYGGRKGFHSTPAIMGVWGKGPFARYMGAFGVLVPMVIYFYYVVIESWCLRYAFAYASGGIGVDPAATVAAQVEASKAYFGEVTFWSSNGVLTEGGIHASLWFWVATFALNAWFVFRGLSRGIEKFCLWAMPTMAVCALIVLGRVLTLPADPTNPAEQNVLSGLNFMWNPDFSVLRNPQTWLAASGQIFFSMSVGFGLIINYASYLRRKDDVVLSGLTAAATNEFFEVALGGMITLTASVVFLGLAATQANSGGTFSTGFFALPVVFARMPAGNFFGAIWFFMLFLAAITSSLSMLQPAKAFFAETLGLPNGKATALTAFICLLGNLFVLWFSQDLVALDTLDFWVGTFLIFLVAGTQIVCFSWVTGLERGLREAHEGAQMRIPRFIGFTMKWISPVYLATIFGFFCWFKVPDYVRTIVGTNGTPPNKVALYSWGLILATITLLMVVTKIGANRWRAAGMDLDGRRPPDDEVDPHGGTL